MGNYRKSMSDINQVLALEPRHFGALAGMAAILSASGEDALALKAWERFLAVYPAERKAQEQLGEIERSWRATAPDTPRPSRSPLLSEPSSRAMRRELAATSRPILSSLVPVPFPSRFRPLGRLMLFVLTGFLAALLAAFGFSTYQASAFERENVNRGELIDVGGFRMNSVHVPRPAGADLPPLVFIHGASANLNDPMTAFRARLEGRAEMLFLDRPGLGYSERGGPRNAFPDGQADAIAA